MVARTSLTVWTIGHSTRTAAEFVDLLRANGVELLADVRRFPGSRRYPHFNEKELAAILAEAQIGYRLMKDLGGRRQPRVDSPNTAWRNASFRGYADYMETDEFRAAIDELLAEARKRRTAIMCSEAVWWQCHRSVISDYLKVRGIDVKHILSPTKVEPHPYTSAAKIVDGQLSYAGDETATSQRQLFE